MHDFNFATSVIIAIKNFVTLFFIIPKVPVVEPIHVVEHVDNLRFFPLKASGS